MGVGFEACSRVRLTCERIIYVRDRAYTNKHRPHHTRNTEERRQQTFDAMPALRPARMHTHTKWSFGRVTRETVAHRSRVGKGTAMKTTTSSSQSAPFVRSHVIPSQKRIRRTRVVHIGVCVCVCSCACVVRTRKRMPQTHSSPKRAVSIRDLPACTYSICIHMQRFACRLNVWIASSSSWSSSSLSLWRRRRTPCNISNLRLIRSHAHKATTHTLR